MANEGAATGAQQDPSQLPGLTQSELDLLKKMFSSPLDIPQEFKAWLVAYLEANPPVLPISQIFGFTDFQAVIDERVGSGTDSTGGYVDLSDGAGPSLSALPKGTYLIMFGGKLSNNASASENYISISINGAAAVDADSCMFGTTGTTQASVSRALLKDLTDSSNTLVLKYQQIGGVTMTVARRWLIALKIANL